MTRAPDDWLSWEKQNLVVLLTSLKPMMAGICRKLPDRIRVAGSAVRKRGSGALAASTQGTKSKAENPRGTSSCVHPRCRSTIRWKGTFLSWSTRFWVVVQVMPSSRATLSAWPLGFGWKAQGRSAVPLWAMALWNSWIEREIELILARSIRNSKAQLTFKPICDSMR